MTTDGETGDGAYWEHFSHEADMGVRGVAQTKAAAFEQAALAMTAIVTDLNDVLPAEPVEVECEAPDDELLFADWLNSLIYEMATRRMLFSRFAVNLNDHHLKAVAWGEKVNVDKHRPAVEIKGATFTSLRVGQGEMGRWIAQTVVDV
jgi:tRNA nucleotidyltransferase (CCA-adding enzyme)